MAKFPNENHTHDSGPIEVRGSKYKIKVTVTFYENDQENAYFNMSLQKYDNPPKDPWWIREELYVTPFPNNTYSEDFTRNNFILFGTDSYRIKVEENKVKSYNIEVYDYY
ncbi:MAG: hypothetical protein FJ150_09685 [Euryarchaeota archaeon]|nr:hypothetical protein [Euryarchaeota archaeon]